MTLRRLEHQAFRVGILLKGVDGVLELFGAVMLLLVSPATVNRVVALLTQHELSEDPHDLFARYLVRAAAHWSVRVEWFAFLYLGSHGLVKLFIVVSLWKERLWSYPVAILFFAAFAVYQTYRYTLDPSPGWVVLTALDGIVILLTWLEYLRVRRLRGTP